MDPDTGVLSSERRLEVESSHDSGMWDSLWNLGVGTSITELAVPWAIGCRFGFGHQPMFASWSCLYTCCLFSSNHFVEENVLCYLRSSLWSPLFLKGLAQRSGRLVETKKTVCTFRGQSNTHTNNTVSNNIKNHDNNNNDSLSRPLNRRGRLPGAKLFSKSFMRRSALRFWSAASKSFTFALSSRSADSLFVDCCLCLVSFIIVCCVFVFVCLLAPESRLDAEGRRRCSIELGRDAWTSDTYTWNETESRAKAQTRSGSSGEVVMFAATS